MPKRNRKGKRSDSADQLYPKGEKNPKNPHPRSPEKWKLVINAGIDDFHCGSRIKMAGNLDMEAVEFAKFHCLICGEKFLSEKEHISHNDKFHGECYLSVCDKCKHPVLLLEEHTIKYHHSLSCMLPKVEEGSSSS